MSFIPDCNHLQASILFSVHLHSFYDEISVYAYVKTFKLNSIDANSCGFQCNDKLLFRRILLILFRFVFVLELEALIFLHACHNSVEKAKICLDTYYTCRTHCPEFFAKRDVNGADVKAQMEIL